MVNKSLTGRPDWARIEPQLSAAEGSLRRHGERLSHESKEGAHGKAILAACGSLALGERRASPVPRPKAVARLAWHGLGPKCSPRPTAELTP